MIATEKLIILKDSVIATEGHKTLPSNARDLIVEVHLTGSATFTVMTSHDQSHWHQVGATSHTHSADVLIGLKAHSVLQYVCIQPTAQTESNVTSAKLYFGRSK